MNASAKVSQEAADIANNIMIVEDDPDLREALADTLGLANFGVVEADCAEKAIEILASTSDISMIISDVNMGEMSGHDLLRSVKKEHPHIPVLLITAYASISESVEAMREGAVDYLVKPFEAELLIETAKRFLGAGMMTMDEPVAVAESSRQLLQLACRVAQSDSTALLIGESGTGKEVLARYIHNHSPRSDKPFVAINCAAIPENMLEAMLFGHEKGAYTGAHSAAPGKFEQASGGTLLLDEISEMDLGLQAKILRVLQEREVERLGGRKSIKLDVRVIATSNKDMRMEVDEGRFREDLYFRLSVLPLQWAPLRDRREDILPLAENLFRRHASKQHRQSVYLSEEAQLALYNYSWPGNVRELDNVMQRALILQPGSAIGVEDLGLQHEQSMFSEKPTLSAPGAETDKAIDDNSPRSAEDIPVTFTFSKDGSSDDSDGDKALLGNDLKKREFEIIAQTLRSENGSKKNTAEKLGISPRTLRYKLAKLREEGYSLDSLVG